MTRDQLVQFVRKCQTPEALDPETMQELAGVIAMLLNDTHHPARELFGLEVNPSKRGPRGKPWIKVRLRAYVALAQLYGHSKNKAIELAIKYFGRVDDREIERIVNATTFLYPFDDPDAEGEDRDQMQAHLESLLPPEDWPKRP